MSDQDKGFVSLTSLKKGAPDADAARAEIRRIYFKTSKKTIEADFHHAIELLKTLPEEERDKVAVYMEGIAEMAKQWIKKGARGQGAGGRKPTS
jgi:hypothetical protein